MSCSSSDAGEDVAQPTVRYAPPEVKRRPTLMLFDQLYENPANNNTTDERGATSNQNDFSPTRARLKGALAAASPSPSGAGAATSAFVTLTPADRIGLANDTAASPTNRNKGGGGGAGGGRGGQRVKAPLYAADYCRQHNKNINNSSSYSIAGGVNAHSSGGPFNATSFCSEGQGGDDENLNTAPDNISLRIETVDNNNNKNNNNGSVLTNDSSTASTAFSPDRQRVKIPFWNKLKAAEAAKAAEKSNALDTMSNTTHGSVGFDAQIRYLHGQQQVLQQQQQRGGGGGGGGRANTNNGITIVSHNGHRATNGGGGAAPWTGGSRGGDYDRYVATQGTRNNKYNTAISKQHSATAGKNEGQQPRKYGRDDDHPSGGERLGGAATAALAASHNNRYELGVKAARQREEDLRLQRKVDRDRMAKALQTAAGKVRREAIAANKPYLIYREQQLLGGGGGRQQKHADPHHHQQATPTSARYGHPLDYDYVDGNNANHYHSGCNQDKANANGDSGPHSYESPRRTRTRTGHDHHSLIASAAGDDEEGGDKDKGFKFRSQHIVAQYQNHVEHMNNVRHPMMKGAAAATNNGGGGGIQEGQQQTQQNHHHDYYFVNDPRDVLDASEQQAQRLRHQHQQEYLDEIKADAAALCTDTQYTREANHIDPITGRRYPRMYSVKNDVDSDSSSDGEYFSLDHRPASVTDRLATGKPRYKVPDAPLFSVDKRVLAEMREAVRQQQEKDSRPRQVYATACGPMPQQPQQCNNSNNNNNNNNKPHRPQTAPLNRRPSSSSAASATTVTAAAAAASAAPPVERPSTANRTVNGVYNQHLNLFHTQNTFKEALPQRLLVAPCAEAASGALSSGNIAVASRPQSVAEHMQLMKKAEAFNKEAVLHGGERKSHYATAAAATAGSNKNDNTASMKPQSSSIIANMRKGSGGNNNNVTTPRQQQQQQPQRTSSVQSLHQLLDRRRSTNGSVMSTAGGVLTVEVGTTTTTPTPILRIASSAAMTAASDSNHPPQRQYPAAAAGPSSSSRPPSSIGYFEAPHRHNSIAQNDGLHTVQEGREGLHNAPTTTKANAVPTIKSMAVVGSGNAAQATQQRSGGGNFSSQREEHQPHTARARIGGGGAAADDDADFIIPTRPSASSRPPTATRRPQSASVRR